MTIKTLINYFKTVGTLNEFLENNSLNADSELILAYMQKPLSIENEISFFEVEKVDDETEFKKTKYFYLFDFHYFLEFIEESKSYKNRNLTDQELAEILLNYAINDA